MLEKKSLVFASTVEHGNIELVGHHIIVRYINNSVYKKKMAVGKLLCNLEASTHGKHAKVELASECNPPACWQHTTL